MQITKKIFRISSIFPCLLCLAISFAREIGNFSCNFEDPKSCQWTQDSSDDFNWTRHQDLTETYTGPTKDHTKSFGFQASKKQGPGSIKHSGGKCIHVWGNSEADLNRTRPKEGQSLVVHQGCGGDRLEFQLLPKGILMFTRHSMCVKPIGRVTDGVEVGVFSSCDATDMWSWTDQESLQYKNKMCLKPKTGGAHPRNGVRLVLDSVCDERQNFFEFVPTSGWYLYIEASSPRQPNDTARLISPSTTETKSCLLFFYHMYGGHVNELRVYVKSGGKMDSVWSLSGNQGENWHQAQVAVNNQTASYQFVIQGVRGKGDLGDIAIDDISLMDSCPQTAELELDLDNFTCTFEVPNSCRWTQDSSDDFDWTRRQAYTPSRSSGPLSDHTKGSVPLANKKQGPGSIQRSSIQRGQCIQYATLNGYNGPKEGQFLVTFEDCGRDRQEFQLWPNGTLMLTRYGMCVKPTGTMTDGVQVGVFSSCDATDTWSCTAQGSLQYKKIMCLKPEIVSNWRQRVLKLMLGLVCDEQQNLFKFVPTSGWYLYIEASSPRQPNDTARLISPPTTKAKSCLLFFYHMYGRDVGELRVYVKSGGKMDSVWSLSGEQGDKWYEAQVAVNNQTASYQFVFEGVRGEGVLGDIAIDDISVMDSCPPRVSTTPASSPFQTSSEDKGTTDDSSRIIIIATTVGVGVFLSIVLIVLLIKYKRCKRAPNISTPVCISLETNAISPEPLPVDEEAVYETVGRVDRGFYENVARNANQYEDTSAEGKGRASLHDRVGVPSNGVKTSEYKTPVENEYQRPPRNETVARVHREFYDDVNTNANASEDISSKGRKSDYEEVEIPSNAHKASGHIELNKRPDTLKTGATGDGDYQTLLKEDDEYVIPAPEKPQHETPGLNETCEEPELSPENPVYTELNVNRDHGRNTTSDDTYQKLVKQDSDYVIPAHERRESYEDIKMGRSLPEYTELDQSTRETEI